MIDWSKYPNFSEREFRCSHCGDCHMDEEFIARLQELRTDYGKPMTITSGYRCHKHPNEITKPKPGSHYSGKAADIHCSGQDAHTILWLAFRKGFTGIGVNMKGAYKNRFIHLDIVQGPPRPNVWSY